MQDWDVPGVALAIVEDGRLTQAEGIGFRDPAQGLLVTPETGFRIGSITKMFTGMLAAQESVAGRLDLDAPASALLGGLEMEAPDSLGDLTLMQLLSHQSGLQSAGLPNDCDTDPDGDARILAERVPEWSMWYPTGELYLYSNEGFALSGYAVELAAGRDYVDLVHERIFEPAGLSTATFDRDEATSRAWALGHSIDNQTGLVVSTHDLYERNCRGSYPSGGIVASVTDLGHLMELLLAEGEGVLTPDTWDLFSTRGWYSSSTNHYGFGLGTTTWRDELVLTHSGTVSGFNALLWVMPERGLGVAVLINSDHTTTNPPEPWTRPTQLVLLQVLETWFGFEHEDIPSSVRPVSEWTRFEGRYRSTDEQGLATISLRGEELWIRYGLDQTEERLYPYSSSRFQYPYLSSSSGVQYWQDVTFEDGDDDVVDWMISRVGVWRRLGGGESAEAAAW